MQIHVLYLQSRETIKVVDGPLMVSMVEKLMKRSVN
jgi:hypothetical protein